MIATIINNNQPYSNKCIIRHYILINQNLWNSGIHETWIICSGNQCDLRNSTYIYIFTF